MAEALTFAAAASAAADVDAGDRLYAALAALSGAGTKQLQAAAERPVLDLTDTVARRARVRVSACQGFVPCAHGWGRFELPPLRCTLTAVNHFPRYFFHPKRFPRMPREGRPWGASGRGGGRRASRGAQPQLVARAAAGGRGRRCGRAQPASGLALARGCEGPGGGESAPCGRGRKPCKPHQPAEAGPFNPEEEREREQRRRVSGRWRRGGCPGRDSGGRGTRGPSRGVSAREGGRVGQGPGGEPEEGWSERERG